MDFYCLNIPDYIGVTPVIGIASDVFDGYEFKSVSLSKNTIWLGEGVFSGCSDLEYIDFNGSKITEIPSNAFKNCAIKSIVLPETITKLGDYAFSGCPLTNINNANIVHYGSYSLQNTHLTTMFFNNNVEYIGTNAFKGAYSTYVFVGENVNYVGSQAFGNAFVYIEANTAPNIWDSSFVSSSSRVITNCRKTDEYIYSVNNSSAIIYRYIGVDKKISVPATINGYSVTEIGYGFDSYNDEDLYDIETYLNITLEEVVIPNSVTKINGLTFLYSRSFIYIPQSVQTMEWGSSDYCYELAFYAFETDEYPFGEYNEDNIRIACGINYDNIVYDEANGVYLYEDLFGYSILASRVRVNENIVIPSEFNGKNIHTIRTQAYLVENVSIKISNEFQKFKNMHFSYGFWNLFRYL